MVPGSYDERVTVQPLGCTIAFFGEVVMDPAPLILTLLLADAAQEQFDALRASTSRPIGTLSPRTSRPFMRCPGDFWTPSSRTSARLPLPAGSRPA